MENSFRDNCFWNTSYFFLLSFQPLNSRLFQTPPSLSIFKSPSFGFTLIWFHPHLVIWSLFLPFHFLFPRVSVFGVETGYGQRPLAGWRKGRAQFPLKWPEDAGRNKYGRGVQNTAVPASPIFYFYFRLRHLACRILVSPPGIKPCPCIGGAVSTTWSSAKSP